MSSEVRWAFVVRLLALLSALLAVVAVLEGRAARQSRAELQQLRAERAAVKAGVAEAWSKQSADEFSHAVRQMNGFYLDSTEGFGRAGGLCPNGQLDEQPVVTYVLGTFLSSRASGRSFERALDDMIAAVRRSDAYRAVHPDLALPSRTQP